MRTVALKRVQTTATLWYLGFDSELVYIGDSGSTEAGPASRRTGIEITNYVYPNRWTAVDLDVSRDGGDTWQPIARNRPGTSLRWIVTPPASVAARVRVRDAYSPTHSDASDALFQIAATTVDVDPTAGLPRVAAIRLAGANPVRAGGALEFRVDVPRAADVRVDVYDVAGRHVRTLARGHRPR